MNMLDFTYVGSFILILWGTMYCFPDLGSRSQHRTPETARKELISQGITFILIGVFTAFETYVDRHAMFSRLFYWISFAMLNTMSIASLFFSPRRSPVAARLYPYISTGSSLMILAGVYVS